MHHLMSKIALFLELKVNKELNPSFRYAFSEYIVSANCKPTLTNRFIEPHIA